MLHKLYERGLTGREITVVQLVAEGLSAKEIAGRLDIAPRTVERHIENSRLKLGARNRSHMINLAIQTGALAKVPGAPFGVPIMPDLVKLQ